MVDQDPTIHKVRDLNLMETIVAKGFMPCGADRAAGVTIVHFLLSEKNAEGQEVRDILRLWYTNQFDSHSNRRLAI